MVDWKLSISVDLEMMVPFNSSGCIAKMFIIGSSFVSFKEELVPKSGWSLSMWMISTGLLFSSDIDVDSVEVLLCFVLEAPSVLEDDVIVVRIKLDRKVKSSLELILLFGHNWLMMADFVVSSSGVVSREHANFAQSNIHDAFMMRWCQISSKCSTYN